MPCKKERALKVVFIETQFVRTDTRHFKSVVQHLTGKDAVVLSSAGGEFPEGRMDTLRDERTDEEGGVLWKKHDSVLPSMKVKKEDVDFSGMSIEEFCNLWDSLVK